MHKSGQRLAKLEHQAERQAASLLIGHMLKTVRNSEDRRDCYLKILDKSAKYVGKRAAGQEERKNPEKELTPELKERIRAAILDPDNRYVRALNEMIDEADPNFAKMTLLNLGYEAFLHGTKTIRENRRKYGCNIPWLILFDPTNACNMHCAGCWSGTYGRKDSLSYADMDKSITQGKELGVYLYMMTGGEPMIRSRDILRLMEKHNDCYFAAFTNATLIDEALCREVQRLGNLTFLLSIEGTEESNDKRRGQATTEARCGRWISCGNMGSSSAPLSVIRVRISRASRATRSSTS